MGKRRQSPTAQRGRERHGATREDLETCSAGRAGAHP